MGAELLESWGRAEEALSLVRSQQGNDRLAAPVEARLLVALGRTQEAIGLLRPHLGDWYYLDALVDSTQGAGCNERVIELLRPLAALELRTGEPSSAPGGLARVLERQGRVDEALQVLRAVLDTHDYVSVNAVEEIARMLARHERLQALQESTSRSYGDHAVGELIAKLEELGRTGDALAAARRAAAQHPSSGAVHLAGVLVRQGRADEALQAARPLLGGRDCGCYEQELMADLIEYGRPDVTLRVLAELTADRPNVGDDEDGRHYLAERQERVTRYRIWLHSETGRADEAIAELEALTDDTFSFRREMLAGILEQHGRADEALAVLAASTQDIDAYALGDLLIRQGRAREAFAVFTAQPDTPFASVLAR
ncbi:tetratricopeptide repeat protein [Streptomyces sp. NPDC048442]|uniref:tetratricopeptide repeat protein n=1 Tax=Streptomyces sp. NPDC048442 TaxID=3154823 RepID=UPI00341771FA